MRGAARAFEPPRAQQIPPPSTATGGATTSSSGRWRPNRSSGVERDEHPEERHEPRQHHRATRRPSGRQADQRGAVYTQKALVSDEEIRVAGQL
jgi:hypothetical protein